MDEPTLTVPQAQALVALCAADGQAQSNHNDTDHVSAQTADRLARLGLVTIGLKVRDDGSGFDVWVEPTNAGRQAGRALADKVA